MEKNAVGGEKLEVAGDETGLSEALAGNLAFADKGGGIDPPSDFARGHIFVPRDFRGNPKMVDQFEANDFLKMATVVSDPLTSELMSEGEGFRGGHARKLRAELSLANVGGRGVDEPMKRGREKGVVGLVGRSGGSEGAGMTKGEWWDLVFRG